MIKRKTNQVTEGQLAPLHACMTLGVSADMSTQHPPVEEIPAPFQAIDPSDMGALLPETPSTSHPYSEKGGSVTPPYLEEGPHVGGVNGNKGGAEQPYLNRKGVAFAPIDQVPGVPGYLAAVVAPFATRWPQALLHVTHPRLLDELRDDLTAAIQTKWGCRRIRDERGYRLVGAATIPPEQQQAWEADHLAADLAWLDFLRRACIEAAKAGKLTAQAEIAKRIAGWVELLTPTMGAMATEMLTLRERIRKADALDAADGWSDEKTAPYMALRVRASHLYDLLDYHAPLLVPDGLWGDEQDVRAAA